MREKWRESTLGPWEVSNLGRVRTLYQRSNCPAGHIIKFRPTHGTNYLGTVITGYPIFTEDIKKPAKRMFFLAHLVMDAWGSPKPFPTATINHKDLDTSNNAISNLEWLSMSENHRHAWENGAYGGKSIDLERLALIRKYVAEGKGRVWIRNELRCSIDTIRKYCGPSPVLVDETRRQQIRDLYARGYSRHAIRGKLHVGSETVLKVLGPPY